MKEQKLAGLIGLAIRARQAAAGMDASRNMIRNGCCGIVLLDAETGPNTRKKIHELCERADTPMRIIQPELIGNASGEGHMLLSIKKGSFADEILRITQEERNQSLIIPELD